MIDYSKWDNLELSDDSDVEVHQNVDKKSFIRMKQRQIHEERIRRDQEIKILTIQNGMYDHLNKRVDAMLNTLSDEDLLSEEKRNKFLQDNFDPEEKSNDETFQDNAPTYNEMIEDLFLQIYSDNKDITSGAQLRKLVIAHRLKIDDVSKKNSTKLKNLTEEKKRYITSEDIHTGFDSFHTNKDKIKSQSDAVVNSQNVPKTVKKEETFIETINSPSAAHDDAKTSSYDPSADSVSGASSEQPEEVNFETLPETDQFGLIKMKKYEDSAKFLKSNPFILTSDQKDALMMKAFDYQLKYDSKKAKNIVHQALIIQYILDLVDTSPLTKVNKEAASNVQNAISLFFNRIIQDNKLLMEETEKTFSHIEQRCEIIKAENNDHAGEEGEEQIQLKSLDPNSELIVNIPTEKDSPEQYKSFLSLPKEMRAAVQTKSLDEINKVFAKMKVSDAENILEIFEKSGVIGIQAVLENEDEFNKMQANEKTAIELKSTDPNAELVVLAPNRNDEEKYKAYMSMPKVLQNAINSESLQQVNDFFSQLGEDDDEHGKDAEYYLGLLEDAGVLALVRRTQPQINQDTATSSAQTNTVLSSHSLVDEID